MALDETLGWDSAGGGVVTTEASPSPRLRLSLVPLASTSRLISSIEASIPIGACWSTPNDAERMSLILFLEYRGS
jgi:hypothetical protein